MKIIFNSYKNDWFLQIYDELIRYHEVILPDNYKDETNKNPRVNLKALEKCAKQNEDANFIFDFRGNMGQLIEWNKKKINIPLVLFDTNVANRPYKAKRSLFAYTWYVERKAIPLMEKYNRNNLIYQGMAANPHIFHPLKIEKKYDIGFIGQHYGDRKHWLSFIHKYCLENGFSTNFLETHCRKLSLSYEEINKIYNQTKINLSFAPGNAVNLRTFEINMSGSFQLMQFTPNINEYYEINKEIVSWKNKKELFEKIQYYLENDEERDKIAEKGFIRSKNNHTWTKRFDYILENLKKGNPDIKKNIIQLKDIIDSQELSYINKNSFKGEIYHNTTKLVISILRNKGYNFENDSIIMRSFKIDNFREKIITNYKPNLKGFYFLQVYTKIILVIKILPSKSGISFKEWNDFIKIFYLVENEDKSLPKFGILTNGFEWLIQDRENQMWIKEIPTKRILKSQIKLKYNLFYLICYHIQARLNKYRLSKLIFIIQTIFNPLKISLKNLNLNSKEYILNKT